MTRMSEHLARHREIEENPDIFKCDICGYRCTMKSGLRLHKIRAHNSEPNLPKAFCDICGKEVFKCLLGQHLKGHRWKENAAADIRECNICGAKVRTKKYFEKHMKAHMNPKSYVCQFCGKRYNYDAGLNNHLHRVHKEVYLKSLGVDNPSSLVDAYRKVSPNMRFTNYEMVVNRALNSGQEN